MVDGKRKKVTEYRRRFKKGVLCGILGGKGIVLWFRKRKNIHSDGG
jgi:hypothetical protein